MLPSLMFWQILILAVLAGSCSVRDGGTGMAFFALLLVVPRRMAPVRYGLLGTAFLLGFGLTFLSLPEAPVCPSWAAVPRKTVLAEGQVVSAVGLPGGRVRVLLKELRPLSEQPFLPEERAEKVNKALERAVPFFPRGGRKDYPGTIVEDETSPFPGLVSMTLDGSALELVGRPLVGQYLRGAMRLYPVGGSVNQGTSDIGAYWADHDVWLNARPTRSGRLPLYLELHEGDGSVGVAVRLRERWRAALETMLTGMEACVSSERAGNSGDIEELSAVSISQGKAMLPALLFGDRSALTPGTVELFTRAGLIHSLALSGQHLALAAMFGAAAIFLAARCRPRLFLTFPHRILVVAAGVPFAFMYLFLGGAPFSLIRAAFMMLAAAFFLCLRRATAPLDALFAAAVLLFLGWPLVTYDLSARLSLLAVAGILLSIPLMAALQKRFPSGWNQGKEVPLSFLRRILHALARWGGSMLLLSCAAQAAVLPILVSTFGAVSPCFWLNLLWLPPLTFITLPCAAAGLFSLLVGAQVPASLLFSLAAWPADIMLDILFTLDERGWLPFIQCFRPSSLSLLGYGAVMVGLMVVLQGYLEGKRPSAPVRRLLFCGLLFMPAGQMPAWADDVLAWKEQRVSLTMFDVGQGQAVLLEYPGGRMLLDGGGAGSPFFDCGRSILAPALTDKALPHLDAVLVSHTDMDHARGLRWILEHFEVGALYWSTFSAGRADSGEGQFLREAARKHGIPERLLVRGDSVPLTDGLSLEVLWPEAGEDAGTDIGNRLSNNDASLALRLVRRGKGLALLCGDMTAPALRRLTESGQDMRAEVLVLPHHGAASSFQKRFYDAVAPELALASAASFNHYGFPSRKVREELARRRIPLRSTTDSGGFSVIWKERDGTFVRE